MSGRCGPEWLIGTRSGTRVVESTVGVKRMIPSANISLFFIIRPSAEFYEFRVDTLSKPRCWYL